MYKILFTARDAAKITFETYNCVNDNEDDIREKKLKAAEEGKKEIQ